MNPAMAQGVVTAAYIAAAVLFILSLGGLSNPETSRRGNAYGMAGMTIAVGATILGLAYSTFSARTGAVGSFGWLAGALLAGTVVGALLAARVKMTQMPELVAMLHSFVGLAAVLVGYANYLDPGVAPRRRGADDPPRRDLPRHPDRRRDLLRLGRRVRQAQRPDRRQAAAAAGAPLAQPRPAGRRGRARLALRGRRDRRGRPGAARRDDGHRAARSACTWCSRSAGRTCRSWSRCSTATPAGPRRPPASCSRTTC